MNTHPSTRTQKARKPTLLTPAPAQNRALHYTLLHSLLRLLCVLLFSLSLLTFLCSISKYFPQHPVHKLPSICYVYINQRDARILVNCLYFFVKWLYMFRTIISPSSGATFNKLYSAIGTCRYVWLLYSSQT